jgi:hypothetical protein
VRTEHGEVRKVIRVLLQAQTAVAELLAIPLDPLIPPRSLFALLLTPPLFAVGGGFWLGYAVFLVGDVTSGSLCSGALVVR